MSRRMLARVTACFVGGVAVLGAGTSEAAAAVHLCVPSALGATVTSGGSGSTCPAGSAAVALPSSASDQQALISILPHIRFNATGVGGKPTITFTGVNLQVLNGAGKTNSVNGTGNLVLG